MAVLGHELFGAGDVRVIVMNDWLCDTSTWDGARAYLDRARFTYAFVDLRGYGRSRGRTGAFTLPEAARDVLDVADALGWPRFAIVGHSMSTLIALHLAQHHAERIARAVLITPPPPRGFGLDDAAVTAARAPVLGGEEPRRQYLLARFGDRLSRGWALHKAERWLATTDAEAAAGYIAMYARDGLPDPTAQVSSPVLAITGELDMPPMRSAAVRAGLAPLCASLDVVALADAGHYPMQETPPLLVTHVERFLAA